MGLGISGANAEGFLVAFDCPSRLTKAVHGGPKIVVSLCQLRFECDGFVEVMEACIKKQVLSQ